MTENNNSSNGSVALINQNSTQLTPSAPPPSSANVSGVEAMPVTLYESYKDATLPPALVIPSSVLALIAFIGICLNSSVVYVTARSKLRGTCHFLLALASFFEVCHQCSHFVYFYNVVFGARFIDYFLCIKIQTVPTFGSNALQLALLSTAVDRLISTLAPIFYKMNNDGSTRKVLYLGAFTVAIFGYGLFSAGYFIVQAAKYSGILVVCDIADTFYAEMYTYYVGNTFVLDVLCAILYAFVWLGIRKNIQASDTQKRLFKSLMTIVVVNVGGYFINLGLMNLGMTYLPWPWSWYQFEFNGVLLNIAAAVNAPILYWMSTEYRQAFNKHLIGPVLTPLLSGSTSNVTSLIAQRSGGAGVNVQRWRGGGPSPRVPPGGSSNYSNPLPAAARAVLPGQDLPGQVASSASFGQGKGSINHSSSVGQGISTMIGGGGGNQSGQQNNTSTQQQFSSSYSFEQRRNSSWEPPPTTRQNVVDEQQ